MSAGVVQRIADNSAHDDSTRSPFTGFVFPGVSETARLITERTWLEGYNAKIVFKDKLLDYMLDIGFSAAFCRYQPGFLAMPLLIRGDFTASSQRSGHRQLGLLQEIPITPTYSWALSPDQHNIKLLVDSLSYEVYPEVPSADFSLPVFMDIPSPSESANDHSDGPSFLDLLKAHEANLSTFGELMIREPSTFLKMSNILLGLQNLDNVQFWDCLYVLERLSTGYGSDKRPEILDSWAKLLEGGLCDTLIPVLRHMDILAVMSAIVTILEEVTKLHRSEAKEARPYTLSMKRLAVEFWKQLGSRLQLLRDDAVELPLAFHRHQSASSLDLRTRLEPLALGFILFGGDPTLSNGIEKDVYRTICRVGLISWLHPTYHILKHDVPTVFSNQLTFPCKLLALFTTFKAFSGLTELDFDMFVEEDIIGEYGAERILLRCTGLLKDLRKELCSPSQVSDVEDLFRNLGRIVAHPEFRQYYTSSGFLSAVCDVIEDQRLQQLDEAHLWRLHRCVFLLVDAIKSSSSIGQVAKPLLRRGIFPILAQSSILFAHVGVEDDHLLDNAIDSYMVIATGYRARGSERDKELFNLIKQSARPCWYSTIDSLRIASSRDAETGSRCQHVLQAWTDLGKALGLQEEQEKAAYEREKKRVAQLCAWKECQFHQTTPPTPTRACAGCREMRYCSRSCQQTDWTKGGHKRQCKRLKSEAHAPRPPGS